MSNLKVIGPVPGAAEIYYVVEENVAEERIAESLVRYFQAGMTETMNVLRAFSRCLENGLTDTYLYQIKGGTAEDWFLAEVAVKSLGDQRI